MLVRRSLKRSLVRYGVSTGTVAVIVAVYFRWLHVNETTVAMTFMVGILLVAANWGLRHAIYLSILSAVAINFFFLPAGHDLHHRRWPQLGRPARLPYNRHRRQPVGGARAQRSEDLPPPPARGRAPLRVQPADAGDGQRHRPAQRAAAHDRHNLQPGRRSRLSAREGSRLPLQPRTTWT